MPGDDCGCDAFGLLRFPFRLTNKNMAPESAVNAADSHIIEIQNLMLNNGDEDGDVLAFVQFASDTQPGQACTGQSWKNFQLRMKSSRLKSLGSAKINEMFHLSRQQRIRRRLGYASLLPPGVRFILDFTPPAEGSQLADLTAALWLPRMVKLWHLAGQYLPDELLESDPLNLNKRPMGDKAVGAVLTLGHDDNCTFGHCLEDITPWQIKKKLPGIVDEDSLGKPSSRGYIPQWRKIDDYCRIRHCVAIMRVLSAINGENLLLNSAPRMWTVAQVAIYLEVPEIVVDPVTQWLIAPPNTKFIEICPERAFQLAYSLKIPSVLATAFRILVSERAVDYLASSPSPRRPSSTWAQRQRDDYGDFPSDPVEYASKAFAERISGIMATLQSDEALGSLGIKMSQWERLKALGPAIQALDSSDSHQSELKWSHENLCKGLTAVFRQNIASALEKPTWSQWPHFYALTEAQRAHYITERDMIPLPSLYFRLNKNQRPLTSIFWHNLRSDGRLTEFASTPYEGKQLWRLAKDFNDLLNAAVSNGSLDLASLSTCGLYALGEFDLAEFIEQLIFCVKSLSDRVLDSTRLEEFMPLYLSDHLLLSLDENELKYLPIWADGLDDGSGGVFQEHIPPAEMGPSEPGPAYHTGYTVGTGTTTEGNSTVAPSDLGIGDLDIYSKAGSTVRSMDAQQSVTTGPARGRVVAVSDSGFSTDWSENAENEYSHQRLVNPADHQAISQAFVSYVDDDDQPETVSGAVSESGDSMAWTDVGSETGAGLHDNLESGTGAGQHGVGATTTDAAAAASTNTAGGGSTATGSKAPTSQVDDFGLVDDEDMADFNDDEDDDDTSTPDGSEFDIV